MSDDEKSGRAGTSDPYPRKYWWIVLVALPIVVALIGLLPRFIPAKKSDTETSRRQSGKNNTMIQGDNNIVNKQTYVINMPTIEKEYAAVKGEALVDGELKKQIEGAIALLNEGKARESAAAFEKINQRVSLPSLQTNLGVAYEKAGNTRAAERTFSKVLAQDPGYSPAQQNLNAVITSRGELVESEPNAEPLQANVLPLEKTVAASITDGSDVDFFKITTPPKYRDIIQIWIENQSTTLRPGIEVFDSNKSGLGGNYKATPGATLPHSFSVQPDTAYFVQVYGRESSTGRYTITVRPLKKYDAYEPNDNIREPAAIEIAKQIDANIMDSADVDFYRFKTGAKGTTVKVHIENQSTTLRPGIEVFDSNKSGLGGNYNATPASNVDHSFSVQPDTVYFVQAYGRESSPGDYSLLVNQQ